MFNRRLLGLGVVWLALGVAVYVFFRSSGSSQFLPGWASTSVSVPHSWRLYLGAFPTFAHVSAFALLSASLVSPRAGLVFCVAWPVVDVALEICQLPSVAQRLSSIDALTSRTPFLSGYLARGTFDWSDVLAAALGGFAAAVVIWRQTSRRTSS